MGPAETSKPSADVAFSPGARGGRRRGRPPKLASGNLSQLILDIAFRQFLESGFAATSMDAVAAEARISKRTLYDRFPSKLHLFGAALHQQSALDLNGLRKFEAQSECFEKVLHEVADWLTVNVLAQRTLALYRLLAAEAHRTPELAHYSEENVLRPVVAALTTIFKRAAERGEVCDLPADFLANQFLQAVCGQYIREHLYGIPSPSELAVMDERKRSAVRLFINGARPTIEPA